MTPNDVKIVADNIDDFIEVPDGINRLRKAVLALAVSGQLVPQNNTDGSADEVYKKYRNKRVEQRHLRKIRTLEPLDAGSAPHKVPNTWCWARLTHLVDQGVIELTRGDVISKNDIAKMPGDYPIYSSSKLNNGEFGRYGKYMFEEELITWSVDGGGYLFYRPKHRFSVTNVSGIMRILGQELLSYEYLFLVLTYEHSKHKFDYAKKAHPSDIRYLYNIPIPPIAEQKRIVEKVQSVMKQLDELEVKKQERDEIRARLTRSAMQALGKGESKIAFEQLTELVKTPSDIKELENALLTLAVSGKLVSQDKKEGTARDLYTDSGVTDEQKVPFEVPRSWAWVRLASVGTTNIGLTYSPSDISDKGIPVLRSSNIQNGRIDLSDLVRVNKDVKDSVLVHEGDLLICARNGSKALVGKTARIHSLDEPMAFGAFMAIFRSEFNTYIELFLKSPVFRRLLDGVATTTINQITQNNLKSTLIPLPPLAEQRRIVEKVEEVMVLINRLKEIVK